VAWSLDAASVAILNLKPMRQLAGLLTSLVPLPLGHADPLGKPSSDDDLRPADPAIGRGVRL